MTPTTALESIAPEDLKLAKRFELEPTEVWAMRRFIRAAYNVVFDVGCGSGRWSQCCHEVTGAMKIHQFDLKHPDGLPVYVKRRSRVAMGSEVGTRIFRMSQQFPDLDSFYEREMLKRHSLQVAEVRVPVATIDSYCFTHSIHKIDFLKIDVEGAEVDVLRGAERMLKHTSVVQFEYGGTWEDAHRCLADAKELLQGWTIYHMMKMLVFEGWGQDDLIYSNYLAIAPR